MSQHTVYHTTLVSFSLIQIMMIGDN